MSFMELVVLLGSGFFSFKYLTGWYKALAGAWPPERSHGVRRALQLLPAAALTVILFTLLYFASFDVVGNFIFIVFYILLGYTCITFGLFLMALWFDLSWLDDLLHLNNRAALPAIAGGYIGLTLIYCGANIGDGPGWWCVIFAGGLGFGAWFALGLFINKLTHIFDRVTVERDEGAGIRLGCYLLASGIVLARASGGDWTSFSMTAVEFLDGWPVLILALVAIAFERITLAKARDSYREETSTLTGSVVFGVVLIALALLMVYLMPPLPSNPIYGYGYDYGYYYWRALSHGWSL